MNRKKTTAALLGSAAILLYAGSFPAQAGHLPVAENRQNQNSLAAPVPSMGSPADARETALPESFDLRRQGIVSPVKDQGVFSLCWSFAACNAMETILLRDAPETDLSEWFLGYYTYNGKFGFPLSSGAGDWKDEGAADAHLASMLTAWRGPMPEAQFPYEDDTVLDETREDLDGHIMHITDLRMMNTYDTVTGESYDPEMLRTLMKQEIYAGHSVGLSYFSNSDYCSEDTDSYYNPGDLNMEKGGYHEVSIVGWDDHYPASAFNTDPGADGAWLMKNSWGTYSGDYGYYWISYEDQTVDSWFSLDGKDGRIPEQMYLHDDCGAWTTYAVSDQNDDTQSYAANIFTAQEDGYITSAMFYTGMMNDAYTVTVYTDLPDETDPSSGTAQTSVSGTAPVTGYHTAAFTQPVYIQAGERFSVVVRYSGDPGYHIGCEYYGHTVYEYSDGTADVEESFISEEMMMDGFSAGQSFVSLDGSEWLDMYDIGIYEQSESYEGDPLEGDEPYVTSVSAFSRCGNVCVRAIVKPVDEVTFSTYNDMKPGETLSLSNVGGYPIYYSVNGENPQLYTKPIVFDAAFMTVTAYVQIPGLETRKYTQSYRAKAARLSGLLTAPDESPDLSQYAECKEQLKNVYMTVCETYYNPESIMLCPYSAGTVSINGQQIPSGEKYTWNVSGQNAAKLLMTVSGENQQDTVYKVAYVNRDVQSGLLFGDANGDGEVDAVDASQILVYAAQDAMGESTYDEDWLFNADFSFDEKTDAVDASQILVYAAEQAMLSN